MTLDDPHVLLYIKPTNPKSAEPVNDEYTQKLEAIIDAGAIMGAMSSDGQFHIGIMNNIQCICGECDEGYDYKLNDGTMTPSLSVHYLRWHRDEIPQSELNKIDCM